MRIVAAMVLSITGAVTAFLAVLTALDDHRPVAKAPERVAQAQAAPEHTDRVVAFAVPGLAASQAHLSTAPQPVSRVARFAASPMLAESRLVVPETSPPVRAAFVPPLPRRKPVEPVLAADATPTASTPAAPVVADAKPVRAKAPASAGPPLDTSTRSALGGPRPAAVKAPKPAAQ